MTKKTNGSNNRETVIGETTPIKIGLVLLLVGALSGAIWWAATITAKLDSIISSQITTTASLTKLDSSTSASIIELKSRDIALDKSIADIKTSIDKDMSEIKLKIALNEVDTKAIKEKISLNTSSTLPPTHK